MALTRRELLQGGAAGAAGLAIGGAVGFGIGNSGGDGDDGGTTSVAGDAQRIADERGFRPTMFHTP